MRFMICYDDSDLMKTVVDTAVTYAEKMNASLEIVHVMPISYTVKPSEIPLAEEAYTKKIDNIMRGVKTPYIAQMLLSNEMVGETLVEYAANNKFDRLFVGVEKTSKVGKLLMGSTAQSIILSAPCPVVTVK